MPQLQDWETLNRLLLPLLVWEGDLQQPRPESSHRSDDS